MYTILSLLFLAVVIYSCVKLYYKVKKTGTRIASYATTTGRNRAALIEELYRFIQSYGDMNYGYVGRESFTLFDSNGARSDYIYRDHGYDKIPVHDGVIDVAERLANKLKYHTVNDFVKVEDRGDLGQSISYAVGNYGSTGGGGYVSGVYLLDDHQYNIWREKVKNNAKEKLKRV